MQHRRWRVRQSLSCRACARSSGARHLGRVHRLGLEVIPVRGPCAARRVVVERRRAVGREARAVVVEPEKVGRAAEHLLLGLAEGRKAPAQLLAHRGGVVAQPDGVTKPAEPPLARALGRGDVRRLGRQRLAPVHVVGHADAALVALVAEDAHRLAVREQHVMPGRVRVARHLGKLAARRLAARAIAEHDEGPRLVEGHPGGDAVGEEAEAERGVLDEVADHRFVEPAGQQTRLQRLQTQRNVREFRQECATTMRLT
eukprot:6196041-Pleurochrysis_carterae.AAC.2